MTTTEPGAAAESAETTDGRIERVRRLRAEVLDEHRPSAVDRQHRLGKLTARERVDGLLDPGTFTEIGRLVQPRRDGPTMEGIHAPADGVVTGTGRIDGRPVALVASDFTVHGGSFGLVGHAKAERQGQLALKHGYPLIELHDGGGHRIQEALDAADAARGVGIVHPFSTLAALSGWVPMCGALLGPSFAAPSNVAALMDFVVAVRDVSKVGIAGPSLVKVALGEQSSVDDLGDPDIQANENGILDQVLDTEQEALAAIRTFLSYLPSNAQEPPPVAVPAEPELDATSLDTVVPDSTRTPYDMRKVLRAVFDGGSLFELKPKHARSVITSFARLDGHPVGIIANQPSALAGALNAASCEKAARFISMCDAFGLPLFFFVDTPGLLIGRTAEGSGLLRRSAKIIHELGQATVPRFTVVTRKGYGLGYIIMGGGRDFDPDACLLWPTADLCGMQIEGAVDVAHRKEIAAAADPAAERQRYIDIYRDQVTVERAASGFGVDEVIEPRATRAYLVEALGRCGGRRKISTQPPKFHSIPPI